MDDEDDDIFNMLLKGNKNKTKNYGNNEDLTFDLKFSIDSTSTSSSSPSKKSERVLEHVYGQHSVLDHCCDDNFVYVLVNINDAPVVLIYHLDHDNLHKPKMASDLSSSLNFSLFSATDKDKPEHKRLYVINQVSQLDAADQGHHDPSVQAGNIHLPSATFASLFGQTTSLVKSSVVLLCTNDGCVYWRPVKCVGQEGRFHLLCHLHEAVNSILLASISRRKSNVDEDVARTLHSALKGTDGGDGDGNIFGLLTVNIIGECCLFVPRARLASGCEQFSLRFCLPYPCLCCVSAGQQFIYSTGWSVESVRLCLQHNDNVPSVSVEDCSTLMLANIPKLFFKTTDNDSDPQLMGLTSDMDRVHIPTTPASDSPLPAPSTHLLPDTVQSIQQHASSMQRLQDTSHALDTHLTQLNVFANLCQQNQQQTNIGIDTKSSPLILCDCSIDHSQACSKGSEIRIQLKNNSGTDLSNQWMVSVTSIRESPQLEDKILTHSFSFKMETGFQLHRTKTFCIPLAELSRFDPLSTLRVRVSFVLCITRKDFCGSSVIHSNDIQDSVLEVEIHTHVFDSLHFLCASTGVDFSSIERPSSSTEDLRVILERFNEKKFKRKGPDDANVPEKQNTRTKIKVPNLADQKSKPEPKEEVLRCLLRNLYNCSDDKSPVSMVCRSPTGQQICFTLEKTEAPSVRGKLSLQLRLESCDIILLCVTHIALLERFQAMSKDWDKKSATKTELENQLLELKIAAASISSKSSKHDDKVSNICKVLDCLGQHVI